MVDLLRVDQRAPWLPPNEERSVDLGTGRPATVAVSTPHGPPMKRWVTTREDDLEAMSAMSSSFRRLRLGSPRGAATARPRSIAASRSRGCARSSSATQQVDRGYRRAATGLSAAATRPGRRPRPASSPPSTGSTPDDPAPVGPVRGPDVSATSVIPLGQKGGSDTTGSRDWVSRRYSMAWSMSAQSMMS